MARTGWSGFATAGPACACAGAAGAAAGCAGRWVVEAGARECADAAATLLSCSAVTGRASGAAARVDAGAVDEWSLTAGWPAARTGSAAGRAAGFSTEAAGRCAARGASAR
ncbi:MAG TPA: hypothetical protein VGJ14_00975 [Sporichthyaceae bacterium]